MCVCVCVCVSVSVCVMIMLFDVVCETVLSYSNVLRLLLDGTPGHGELNLPPFSLSGSLFFDEVPFFP